MLSIWFLKVVILNDELLFMCHLKSLWANEIAYCVLLYSHFIRKELLFIFFSYSLNIIKRTFPRQVVRYSIKYLTYVIFHYILNDIQNGSWISLIQQLKKKLNDKYEEPQFWPIDSSLKFKCVKLSVLILINFFILVFI